MGFIMPIEPIDGLQIDLSNYGRSRRDLLRDFMQAIYPLVEEINEDIDAYNALDKSWGAWLIPSAYMDEKAEHLALIESKIKAMHDAQSDDDLVCCPDYFDKIQTKLFREIQAERQKLHQEAEDAPVTLTTLIAGMDPEKANQLTGILANKKGDALHDALRRLYQPGEAGEEIFAVFLDAHTIVPLKSNNSKNFKVVNKKTNEAQVLKIDNRLGQSRKTEVYLRSDALPGVFTGIFADRAVIYRNEKTGALESRGLQVTEFCPGSDVAAYGAGLDDEIREESAVNIYMQMLAILKETESNQSFFPDIKNTNWLIDASGRVRVADGKSLVFSDLNGNIDERNPLIHTPFISAPEMRARPRITFSADKAHVYMLGKDLYQYLTQCSYEYFYVDPDHSDRLKTMHDLDFSGAVFQGPQGRDLAKLIQSMLNEHNPGARPSVAFAQVELQRIGEQSAAKIAEREKRMIESLYNDCSILWIDLEALSVDDKGEMNAEMQTFLSSYEQKLMGEAKTIEALEAIKSELEIKTNDFLAVKKDALKDLCYELLGEINGFRINVRGVQDVEMKHFILEKYTEMTALETLDALEIFVSELRSSLSMVEKNHDMVQEVTDLINQEGHGMEAKGLRIAEAYVRVPLDKRGAILEVSAGGTKETENVLKEMASSRLLPRFMHGLREGPGGRLSAKKAATMFKAFKARHQDDLLDSESPQVDDEKKPKRP